jgi:hypothetical protein
VRAQRIALQHRRRYGYRRRPLLQTSSPLKKDNDWVTPARRRVRMAKIMPAAVLHTDRCCCWFEEASSSIVVIGRRTRTALGNPFLSLAELAQALVPRARLD